MRETVLETVLCWKRYFRTVSSCPTRVPVSITGSSPQRVHLAPGDFLAGGIANILNLDLEYQGLSRQRVVAIQVGDPVPNILHGKADLIALFVPARHAAPGNDVLARRKLLQGDLAYQGTVTLAKGVIGQESDPNDITDRMLLQRLLQLWKQAACSMQVLDRFAGGLADHGALAVGQ